MSDADELAQDELAQAIISDERFREWITKIDFPDPGQDSIMPMLFVGSMANDGDPLQLTGATMDGRAALIMAPILRDTGAVISGYGPRVSSYDEKAAMTKVEPTLLMEFFKGYLIKKFGAPSTHASH